MLAFVLKKDVVNRHLEEKLAAAIAKWAFYNAGSLRSFSFFYFSCVYFLIRALQIKENAMSGRLIKKMLTAFVCFRQCFFFFLLAIQHICCLQRLSSFPKGLG